MNFGDVVIGEATNELLLISTVIGLRDASAVVSWTARLHRARLAVSVRPPTEGIFSLRLVLRFAELWLLVVIVGLAIAFYLGMVRGCGGSRHRWNIAHRADGVTTNFLCRA